MTATMPHSWTHRLGRQDSQSALGVCFQDGAIPAERLRNQKQEREAKQSEGNTSSIPVAVTMNRNSRNRIIVAVVKVGCVGWFGESEESYKYVNFGRRS